jgi:hypothetical protein
VTGGGVGFRSVQIVLDNTGTLHSREVKVANIEIVVV